MPRGYKKIKEYLPQINDMKLKERHIKKLKRYLNLKENDRYTTY